MNFFRTVQGRLVLLGVVAVAAQLALGWFSYDTVETVRIDSPAYKRIDTQKDLINDLSPPALNVVRAMLAVTGVDPGGNPEVVNKIIAEAEREKTAFQKAESIWPDRSASGTERNAQLELVLTQGAAFYDITDPELIPALRGGVKEK